MAICQHLMPTYSKPPVVPATTTYDTPGAISYPVPAYNTLTIELWGSGASGGPSVAVGSVPAGVDGNASTISAYSLTAGGGKHSTSNTTPWPGGVGGTASGGNTTNTAGTAGGAGNYNKLNASTTSGAGGAAPSGGAGGASASVPIGSGTGGTYVSGNAGTAPGGGGSGGGGVIFVPTGGGNRYASGYQGGGGGGYVKHVFTFGVGSAPAIGASIAGIVAAAVAASGSGQGGASGHGRIKITVT